MKKRTLLKIFSFIIFIFIACLILLRVCDSLENKKEEYHDWESYMNVPKLQRKLNTPLFDGSISFQGKIFNIITYYNFDTTHVYGQFNYKNNIFEDFPIQINTYTENIDIYNIEKKLLEKIGFKNNKIEYYFYEVQERSNRNLYYFIDTNDNIVYFSSNI